MARVLVGVTGGIAAYKACELVRLLVRAGHEVTSRPDAGRGAVRHAADVRGARAPRGPRELYPHLDRRRTCSSSRRSRRTRWRSSRTGWPTTFSPQAALAFRGPGPRRARDERAHVGASRDAGERRHTASSAAWRSSAPRRGAGRGRDRRRAHEPSRRTISARCRELLGQARLARRGRRVVVTAGGTREPLDPSASSATAPPGGWASRSRRRRAPRGRRDARRTQTWRSRAPGGVEVDAGADRRGPRA